MRVAAVYDIHANVTALEAVLKEIATLRIDMLVVGGDVITGPMPNETLALLDSYQGNKVLLKGNAETDLLNCLNHQPMHTLTPYATHQIHWLAKTLKQEYIQQIVNWQFSSEIHSPELGRMLFCHATPRDNHEIFTEQTPVEQLTPMLGRHRADVIVCGHTHMPYERRLTQCRIVNAGSAGMPVGSNGASWVLLDGQISFKLTTYDIEAAAQRIRQSSYPDAENFVQQQILNVPDIASQQQLLAELMQQQQLASAS
ncbi:metallophosphoesterase family protein [Shewanella sp.]|uniref:metallophosphoesterase family protein n=1 Tax=Shewanella sp. TaxID=50422 RepID=UPI003A971FCC